MDSIAEKFSIFDYFNMIIGGAVFLFGIGICYHTQTWSLLDAVNSKIEDSVFLLILAIIFFVAASFVAGTVINEIGNLIFKQLFRWESKLISTCLTDSSVVDNQVKLEIYKNKAKDYFSSCNIHVGEVYTEDQCDCFFAYCIYFVQIRNLNKKTERLREVQGLSNLLTCVFSGLSLISLGVVIRDYALNKNVKTQLLAFAVCTICAIIFFFKHRRDMFNRIRMILAVFNACIEKETNVEVENGCVLQ